MKLRPLFLLLLFLLLLLGSCTFTYIPLVREARAPEPHLTVLNDSRLVQNETSLKLTLELATIPEADWLAVQWFDPSNDEVAATSLWLEPAPKAQTVTTSLPPRIPLEAGLWRAIISYQGMLLRQFSVTVGEP